MKISWYGRCCFLVDFEHAKVLFDPYDLFCNVDIGMIEADILLTSSTWHDHGHIGASPGAWIYSYKGSEENFGIKITGVEALEDRGSPTVIFNIRYQDYSITNFADFGTLQVNQFEKNLSSVEREVLTSTNIAFARPSITSNEIQDHNEHNEVFLKYCQPAVIFPEHYLPRSFIQQAIPQTEQDPHLKANIIVDEMPEALDYKIKEIPNFQTQITVQQLQIPKQFFKFLQLHTQVKYSQSNINRSW